MPIPACLVLLWNVQHFSPIDHHVNRRFMVPYVGCMISSFSVAAVFHRKTPHIVSLYQYKICFQSQSQYQILEATLY